MTFARFSLVGHFGERERRYSAVAGDKRMRREEREDF